LFNGTMVVTKERKHEERPRSLLSAPMSRKEFAEETFAAFEPFINIFDPGEKSYYGEVYHTITKEDWRNYHRWKNGEHVPGFSAKYDVALKIYKPWHAEQHIFHGRTSYGTSGRNGLGFLYQDIDAHLLWQTDQERARELLEIDFPFGFFRRSNRGENGYLKTRYMAVSVFNKTAARMEDVIQHWFLHNEILCDYETKGTITTPEKSGSLAKLPFATGYCERMLLERQWPWWEEELLETCDDWCYYRLEEFKSKEIVNVAYINRILDQIESRIDDEKVRNFAAHKEEIKAKYESEQEEVFESKRQATICRKPKKSHHPSLSSLRSEKDGSLGRAINCGLEPVGEVPSVGKADLHDIRQITNAHTRRRKFAWWLSCRLRRVATVEETLAAYKEYHCFRGTWEDGLDKRTNHFASCLDYAANIFDPSKCGHAGSQRPQLDEHIRECFGIARYHLIQSGLATVKINVRVWSDEYGQRHETAGKNRVVDRQHAHFLHAIIRQSVSSFSDGAIPLKTMRGWWDDLAEEGKLPEWNYDYYLACRRFLEKLGWIKVSKTWSSRSHKAQTCQITYRRKRVAGTVYSYPKNEELNNTHITITVITQSIPENLPTIRELASRPPPRGKPPPSRWFSTQPQPEISWN